MAVSEEVLRKALEAADTQSPNFITVDKEGKTGAEFEGHIVAFGIDLPEDIGGSPETNPNNDSILGWYDTLGILHELIVGNTPNTKKESSRLILLANASEERPNGELSINAVNALNQYAQLRVNSTAEKQTAQVVAKFFSRTLLNETGESRYRQLNSLSAAQDYGIVVELPVGVAVGSMCYFIAGGSELWHLLYDGVGEFPWKFIGGAPLYSEVEASQGTASEAFGALATAGPSITVPLKGDYDVTIGTRVLNTTNGGSSLMSYSIGGTGAVTADAIDHAAGTAGANVTTHQQRTKRKTKLAAKTELVAKYRRAAAGTATFQYRWMSVSPVRVG